MHEKIFTDEYIFIFIMFICLYPVQEVFFQDFMDLYISKFMVVLPTWHVRKQLLRLSRQINEYK